MKKIISFFRDRHDEVYKASLIILSILAIVSLFPKEGKFKYEYQKGKPWLHETLIAPFDFAINKSPEEIEIEQEEILGNRQYYFVKDDKVKDVRINNFKKEFAKKEGQMGPSRSKLYAETITLLDSVYDTGIIELNESIENKSGGYSVLVMNDNIAEEYDLEELFTVQQAFNFIVGNIQEYSSTEKRLIIDLLEVAISQNVLFDKATTDKMLKDQLDNLSLTRSMRQEGERIITKGDIVDNEKYQILESLRSEYIKQLGGTSKYFTILTGQLILVTLALLILIVFLLLFRKDIIADNSKITFILLILFLIVLVACLNNRFNIASIYVIPFCLLPVIVRAFFDTRVATFTHLVTILIVGLIAPNPFEFIFIQLIGGIFAIFSIISMRKRSQLFMSVSIIFIAYVLAYLGISIIHEGTFAGFNWINIGWFGTSAMLTLFSYPLIYVFERTFGFISDVSLMELADINTPLLREFSVKAPGTFQHSLQVANLAEDAIYKIGGNTLLVRAGAIYHDIGKMDMPMYFIENQLTGVNPHDELSYEESASIITSHVIKGIEKAKKFNVPDQIIDFIRTHHGTTKAQYFYQSFLKNFPNEKVDELAFQYPGPIPFSKETAVLMMADSVEAASRSLQKVDAEIIDKLVDQIIDHQIEQKQFINADITFKNVSDIKRIFKKKLMNIYHLRVEYPK